MMFSFYFFNMSLSENRGCKGLVTHKRKSFNIDLHLIAKISFCFLDLLYYVPVNSYGHVGTLDVQRDVTQ